VKLQLYTSSNLLYATLGTVAREDGHTGCVRLNLSDIKAEPLADVVCIRGLRDPAACGHQELPTTAHLATLQPMDATNMNVITGELLSRMHIEDAAEGPEHASVDPSSTSKTPLGPNCLVRIHSGPYEQHDGDIAIVIRWGQCFLCHQGDVCYRGILRQQQLSMSDDATNPSREPDGSLSHTATVAESCQACRTSALKRLQSEVMCSQCSRCQECQGPGTSRKVDIWSLGVIYFDVICSGHTPETLQEWQGRAGSHLISIELIPCEPEEEDTSDLGLET
jgi:hypothetical protein